MSFLLPTLAKLCVDANLGYFCVGNERPVMNELGVVSFK